MFRLVWNADVSKRQLHRFAWTTSGMEAMNAIVVAITDSKKKHDKDKTVEHIEPEKLPGK